MEVAGHGKLDADLSWVEDEWLVLYCLTGVRSSDTDAVFAAVGADCSEGLVLNADDATTAAAERRVRSLRVASVGEWSILLELDSMLGAKAPVFTALSQGTDVVVVHSSEGTGLVRYVRDGTEVSTFEPLVPSSRYGREPDLFVERLHAVGLLPDNGDMEQVGVKALRFVAEEFGVVFGRDVVLDHAWPTGFVPRFRQRGAS